MSHSTQSGFSAAFSDRGCSWWITWADRLEDGGFAPEGRWFQGGAVALRRRRRQVEYRRRQGQGSRSSRPCSACGRSHCPTGTHPGLPRPGRWICRRQGAWETSAATIKVRWRSCHAPTPQAGNTNGRTAYPAFARSKIVLSSPILMKPATFSPSTQRGRSSVITRHISGHR